MGKERRVRWRDRLRGRRPASALTDRARAAAGQVGNTAPAGRGGLPAALARALRRRAARAEDDEASGPSADEATIQALRADLARELARASERSDEQEDQGEGRPAGR